MKGHIGILALLLASLGGSFSVHAANGSYADQLPSFTLKDPGDKEHTQAELLKNGAVIIITIPNVKQGEIQTKWSKWLTKPGWVEGGPLLVMVQDLSQSNVKDKAIDGMKKRFVPEKQPLLLLDHTGEVRRSFHVRIDETIVLIYDKNGKLVHAEDDEEATPEAAQRVRSKAESMKSDSKK